MKNISGSGAVAFTVIGGLGVFFVMTFLVGPAQVQVNVAQPTVVYESEEVANATQNYVEALEDMEGDRIQQTVIAHLDNEIHRMKKDIISDLSDRIDRSVAIHWSDMQTAVAAGHTPTPVPYAGAS